MSLRALLSVLGLISVAASCTAESGPDGAWQVVTLGANAIEVADGVTLTLADGQASGRSGCNRFNGRYTVQDQGFTFGPLMATRMACPGRAGTIESQFNQVIDTVTGWQRDGDALVLTDGTVPVIRAVPQIAP